MAEDRRDAIRDRNRRARQEAADRRRARRVGAVAPEIGGGLDASERVDDALVRVTFTATKWLRKNAMLVQTVLVLSFLGLVGWTAYRYFRVRSVGERSDQFYAAIERVGAPVGDPPDVLNPEGNVDPRPVFPDENERLAQATAAFEKASTTIGRRPLGVLAELGQAGVLLEAGKYDDARAKYDAVKNAARSTKDQEPRGRALEGVGLALEGKKDLDGALKAYQELENLGVDRFTRLALYHRARVHHLKGEDKTAKELVTDLLERLGKPESPMNPGYLRTAARELLLAVDPSTPVNAAEALGDLTAAGADADSLKQRLEDLLREVNLPVAPSGSPAPAPAPSETP
ncbi:MAG: hypothetical protein JW751_11360 [Polyangiaceae bacterium]|nr:hypothetical protein [Polyangiaceae bacterium]